MRIPYIGVSIALVAVISVLGLLFYHFFEPFCSLGRQTVLWCADKDRIRIWLESWGHMAPLIFILIQSLQVVMAPIPGEVTGFLGGFLFGATAGFFYSTLGITLGSSLAFWLGRVLEMNFIENWVRKETLAKSDFLIERQGALVAFFLFLVPGAPKDYLCIILGLSRMPFKVFLPLMALGRMPATFLLTLQGAQVYQGNHLGFLILVGLLLVVAGVLIAFREKFYQFLRNWSGPPQE
ncbi:MAG: TVP38/TMEM64 family protein [Thermodesulfobacteriota bacterium]